MPSSSSSSPSEKELENIASENENNSEIENDHESKNDSLQDDENDDVKRKTHNSTSSEEELDDEDLELIEENTGMRLSASRRKNFKRLKRRTTADESDESDAGSSTLERRTMSKGRKNDLANLFADEEDQDAIPVSGNGKENEEDEDEEEDDGDDDDLHDFIEEDDEEFAIEERVNRLARQKAKAGPSSGRTRAPGGAGDRSSTLEFLGSKHISNEAWREMMDIFGEGYDYAEPDSHEDGTQEDDRTDAPTAPKSLVLEDSFEPSLLIEKLFTDEDEAIRIMDIPERMQLRDTAHRSSITEEELRQESVWISNHLAKLVDRPETDDFRKLFLGAVASIVKFIREDYYEIPFIASHRKEYFHEILSLDDLWSVYDLDEKWKIFQDRKSKLIAMMESLKSSRDDSSIPEEPYVLEMLQPSSLDDDDLDDLYDFLNSKYERQLSELAMAKKDTSAQLKRPTKRVDLVAVDASIVAAFSQNFGITPKQYGINLTDNYRRFDPEDAPVTPETLAESFQGLEHATIESVLVAAAAGLAKEFACDPRVRKTLRPILEAETLITTSPTPKGLHEIDATHEFANIKYITRKPYLAFTDDHYLEIMEAVNAGLLTVKIEVSLSRDYVKEIELLMTGETYSSLAAQWNPFRLRVLREALAQYIYPFTRKKVESKLATQAIKWVGKYCQHALLDRLLAAPWRRPEKGNQQGAANDEDNDEESSDVKIMSLSWGEGLPNSACFAAVIDSEGKLIDHLRLSNMTDRYKKYEDYTVLMDWMLCYRPEALCISGTSVATRNLFMDMNRVLDDNRQKWANASPPCSPPHVMYAEDDVARIFQTSQRAKEEFPSFAPLLAYCVSVARRMLDPLAELAGLANTQNDILQLKLHPAQHMIPQETLLKYYHRAFINIVNLVGVDLNRAVKFPLTVPLLQFVCGLGPRKVQSVLKNIARQGGVLERRNDLIRKGIVGKRVFLNCASFFRINEKYLPRRRSVELDVLDSTRIHPENYELARKMAADALDVEEALDGEQNPSQHVEDLMLNPKRLNDLLLDEYAKELEKRQRIQKHITLKDIRIELQAPYKDRRQPRPKLSTDRLFTLLTGETDRSLFPGLLLSVEVTRLAEKSANCRLQNGLSGSLFIKCIADTYVQSPSDYLTVGQTIVCKVLQVNKEKFSVDLTCRPSELKEGLDPNARQLDPYYDLGRENADKSRASLEKEKSVKMNPLMNASGLTGVATLHAGMGQNLRQVKHPLFKNMNRMQAEEALSRMNTGDVIIRPSSKGHDTLVVSWRLEQGVVQHIDVREGRKDPTNPYTLGKDLWIGDEKFEDLDEILARHIEPMIGYVQEALLHAKYVRLVSQSELESFLKKAKASEPRVIAYCLSLSHEMPGKLRLGYQPGERAHVEFITLTPNGFRFRKSFFDNLQDLINSFKRDMMQQSKNTMRR